MVDSNIVLMGQTYAYTFYVLAIMSVMAWFSYKITRTGTANEIKPALFYSFVTFLVVLGVSLHIATLHTIPWKPLDLNRADIKADKVFNITVAKHKFHLPEEKMVVRVNEKVVFNVISEDLTYGFGLFREDHSMLFQMQVIPGHNNDLIWQFAQPGIYSIRSTEYSGPKGISMVEKNTFEVLPANP